MKRMVLSLLAATFISATPAMAQNFEPLEALLSEEKLVASLNNVGKSNDFPFTRNEHKILNKYLRWLSDDNGNIDRNWLKSRQLAQINTDLTAITGTITLAGRYHAIEIDECD